MVENSNQNCRLDWLDEGLKGYINEEIFNRNLVVGGHNGSSTATFICRVSDLNPTRGYKIVFHQDFSILIVSITSRVIGQYNREEEVCYIPVGDKVHPFSGDGIQLLINQIKSIKDIINGLPAFDKSPPSYLSGIAGVTSFRNAGRFCSNR